VHDIAAFKFVKVIGWVWQFTLQSAQRHNQISKIGDIFEKISTVAKTIHFSVKLKVRFCNEMAKISRYSPFKRTE
jgi:hypothetical protein